MKPTNNISLWPSFEKWLAFPGEQIKKVFRWGKFLRRTKKQSTLEHTLQQTLLTIMAIFIENPEAARSSAPFMITVCAILHDFGERPKRKKTSKKWNFDDAATDKVGNNGEKIQERERKKLYNFVDKVPLTEPTKSEVITFLIDCYEIQYLDTELGKYFNSLERLGYCLHALDECRAGNLEYAKVFLDNHKELLSRSQKFKSISTIYQPYMDEIKSYYLK